MESGTQLGHYEILSAIGKGGMGEVWRARDTKLGREVAIKTLPEEFAKDADRLARFEREAKLLASLNHPNIAAIHGFEEDNGTHFLVLELVEGDTLADQIKRGPIVVEESLKLALQIAEALEAAHEKGVIHRDLKPANIKVTPDGKVKVLDFGLAKAFAGDEAEASVSNSPTLSMQATQQGVILGTAAYMSPEQARGEEIDSRADVWAFGCVLFEMLTGRGTFDGKTVSDILASVLKVDPEWKSLPQNLHPRLRLLLDRCLEKEAKDRYHGISDARIDIRNVLADSSGVLVQPVAEVVQATPQSKWPWVAAIALSVIVAGVVVWNLKLAPAGRMARFEITPPETAPLEITNLLSDVAISPDGTRIVYTATANRHLYMRTLDQIEAIELVNLGETRNPFFSPDGTQVGFHVAGENSLRRVSIQGGPPQAIVADTGSNLRGASWGPDNTIVFATNNGEGLMRVAAAGGEPTALTTAVQSDGPTRHYWPEVLPDGRAVLFTVWLGSDETSQIAVLNLETGEQEILVSGGTSPRYVPTGHILYATAGSLWAVPFDINDLEVTGDSVPVLENLTTKVSGAANFSVSEDGLLVYVPDSSVPLDGGETLVWMDRQGNSELLGAAARNYIFPRLSPDGQSVAVMSDLDIWRFDIARQTLTRLTFRGNTTQPVWTPDGQYVAYRSIPEGDNILFWTRADGSGTEEQLTTGASRQNPTSWSPDGQLLAFFQSPGVGGDGDRDIWMMPLDGDREPRPFLETPFNELVPMFAPDGRWVAYVSDESGRNEVYVLPFPGPGGKRQISTEGGGYPQWARDGQELFYMNDLQMMAVDIETEPGFMAGTPRLLFEEGFVSRAAGPFTVYDVSADGQRFLMVGDATSTDGEAGSPKIIIVQNWFEELTERVPVP